MKKERLKKMQDKRAENRQKRKSALENKDDSPEQDKDKQPNQQSSPNEKSIDLKLSIPGFDDSIAFAAPRLIFQDGKPVLDTSHLTPENKTRNKELTLADKKTMKTTSMSFKPRNHTEKWSPEETKKFLKVIKNSYFT
jgi:hypothetical protein